MNEEITQEELSPEEAKAALGLSTRLSEQYLMSQVPQEGMEDTEGSESPEMASESVEEPEVEEEDKFDPEAFKKEIMEEVKKEVGGIKEAIADALNDNE